jgi:hypothetical protein
VLPYTDMQKEKAGHMLIRPSGMKFETKAKCDMRVPVHRGYIWRRKKPTRCHLKNLLFLGTAQHVSGTHMPIIRSLRLH